VLASAHLIYEFVDRAARAEGIEDLGWQVGIATRMGDLGELGAAFGAGSPAACLHDALELAFAHARHESRRIHLWIQRHGKQVRLCYSGSVDPKGTGFDQVEQYMVGLLVAMVRQAAGPSWVPTEIHLRVGGASPLERVECLADVRIRSGAPITAVALPSASLCLPLRRGAHARRLVACPLPATGAVAGSDLPAEFCDSIAGAMRPYLSGGAPSIELAARLANTSVRSLQRSLAGQGLSFSRLVEQLRLSMATELLSDPRLKLVDIASELGYSDAAHFTRAFRRWTGSAPSEYRRSLLGQA
jgi:AraC-like DNA-binding protein